MIKFLILMIKLREWIGIFSPFRYKAVRCGHRTKRTGAVSAFGYTTITKMPRNKNGSIDYCLDCIGKMAIQCAWCGNPIFIGDPITLYTPNSNKFQIPEHAIVYNKKPLQLVGCFDWDCVESDADRAGLWLPNEDGAGHVHRVPTAYEAILGVKKSPMIIIRDVIDTGARKKR